MDLKLFALNASRDPGSRIADMLAIPLAAHEERECEDGEHKSRPLESVRGRNTARVHELGRTRDWVVVYFYDDDHAEGPHNVVTEARGPLAGRRVVRGREAECRALYAEPVCMANP